MAVARTAQNAVPHPRGTVCQTDFPRQFHTEREDYMTVNDRSRLELHRKLEAVLGTEEADTLMEHLPPVTWHDVATKDDVRSSEAALRSELTLNAAVLRGEMNVGFADVRVEMNVGFADVRAEMNARFGHVDARFAQVGAEITSLRGEMHTGFAEVSGEVHRAIIEQTCWILGFVCAWSAVVITVSRLLL